LETEKGPEISQINASALAYHFRLSFASHRYHCRREKSLKRLLAEVLSDWKSLFKGLEGLLTSRSHRSFSYITSSNDTFTWSGFTGQPRVARLGIEPLWNPIPNLRVHCTLHSLQSAVAPFKSRLHEDYSISFASLLLLDWPLESGSCLRNPGLITARSDSFTKHMNNSMYLVRPLRRGWILRSPRRTVIPTGPLGSLTPRQSSLFAEVW
jgi:hypothetical protein